MPGKWKVQVVSQKHSTKARNNWRSLYSYVSWFDKASKKAPKSASLMMLLMLGDNAAHAFFNIWRLPRLLNFATQKFSRSISMTKTHITKKFHTQKKNNILIINTPSPQNQFNATPKCHHYQIFHISIQPPNFSIAMQKEKIPTWPDKKNSHKYMHK